MQDTDQYLPINDEPHVFNIDYFDLNQVKALARSMGKGHLVVKHPDRPNYNICHSANEWKLEKGIRIVYRS